MGDDKVTTEELMKRSKETAEALFKLLIRETEGHGALVVGSMAFLVGALEDSHKGTTDDIVTGALLVADDMKKSRLRRANEEPRPNSIH